MKKSNVIIAAAAVVVSAVAVTACAQGESATVSYNITGKCPAGVATVYVYDPLTRAMRDSVDADGGTFSLRGDADRDALLALTFAGSHAYMMFFNDGEPISADLATMTLGGSEMNTRLNAYDRQIDSLAMEASVYVEQFNRARAGGMPVEQLDSLARRLQAEYIDPLNDSIVALTKKIIAGNGDNLIPVVFIRSVMYDCEIDELRQMCSYDKKYASHPMMAPVRRYLASLEEKMAVVGTMFTDVELTGSDGLRHRLSDYCGKGYYVLIDFWASWCQPCRMEMPNVKANYEKYHPKGFDIVGISLDSDADAWKKAIGDMGLDWRHLSDLNGWSSAAAAIYNIRSIPSSILVGPDGRIAAVDLRGEQLGKKLRQIYGY